MAVYGPHAAGLALAGVCTIGVGLSHLIAPYVIKIAVDRYIASGNLPGLTFLVLLYAGNALAGWWQYNEWLLMERAAQRTAAGPAPDAVSASHASGSGLYDRHAVGRLMSRVQNDVGTLQDLFTSGILSSIGDLLTLVGIVVVMLVLHVKLTLITLTVLPLMVLLTISWRTRSRRAFQGVRAALAQVNAGLQENISGVRVIQSLCSEGNNLQRFEGLNWAHFAANLTASRLSAFLLPTIELIGVLGIALVVVFGGPMVLAGSLSAGSLVAFVLYIQRFF